MNPPSSNTGGKSSSPSSSCHVDALAFSFKHPGFNNDDLSAFGCLLSRFFPAFHVGAAGRGRLKFTHSAEFSIGGFVAWGGLHMFGTVYVSLMGMACATCTDWAGLARWLEEIGASLRRVDIAYDDMESEHYSPALAMQDYRDKKFITSGAPPSYQWVESGNDFNNPARTFYVGQRENGKMLRVYDKGRQLGDVAHPNWTRIEVELRGKDRVIPYDALTQPHVYLAGAYPPLSFISTIAAKIKTARRIVERTLDQYITWAQRQVGRVLYAATLFHHGDIGQVFTRIARHELPARLLGAQSFLAAT